MSTKHTPILFSGPMVRALLDGSKTQTRRVVKAKHLPWLENSLMNFLDGKWNQRPMPYGKVGDRLWVRETWAHYQTVNSRRRYDGASFSEVSDGAAGYRADGHETIDDFRQHIKLMSGCDLEDVAINGDRWRPSIHMPRWASRITLEITGVRASRLQDISEADAIAEGIEPFTDFHPTDHWRRYDKGTFNSYCGPIESYASLWESINGPGSWNANPWVWVLEFKRVKGGAA